MQTKQLRQAKKIENVFNSAYWHLSQQDYTINEIRIKLERKTDNIEWIETVLSHLIENNYLKNDLEFAIRFCELAFSREFGACAIKQKLKTRRISAADIDTAIEQVMDEKSINLDELATSRLLNKFESFHGVSKEKVYAQMMTKGFTRSQIEHALLQHPEQNFLRTKLAIKADKADLETEIMKLYKKGKGKIFILQDLKQRLIDVAGFDDLIYQLVTSEEVDFYLSCKNQLEKKRFNLSDHKEKSKAYAYLTRKGFESDEIKEALSAE